MLDADELRTWVHHCQSAPRKNKGLFVLLWVEVLKGVEIHRHLSTQHGGVLPQRNVCVIGLECLSVAGQVWLIQSSQDVHPHQPGTAQSHDS